MTIRKLWARTFLSACMLAAATGTSASDPLLDEIVSFSGTVFQLETGVPGVVVAVVRDGETSVAGFGETAKGSGIVPDGDTILRIGSITKVFTGEMLAHAVARGETQFTAPAAPLLTGRLGEAAARQSPIRLVDLSTHAAGLPREAPHEDGPADDPFANISLAAFADWLEHDSLLFRPGTAISYSNFGFDLLSAALAQAGGKSYAALLKERVTGPLSMNDTGFEVAASNDDRLMTGHNFDGSPMPEVPSGDVITGSGGLRTTANDMLKWLQWHLSTDEADAEVRFLTHAAYVQREGMDVVHGMDESGHMDAMGLGWVVMNRNGEHPFILQKAGALQGQMSYVALAPKQGTAVFVTMNKFDFSAAYAMAGFANELLMEISGN